ncbi:G-box-binding factor 1 isoform X1 [Brassica rapa]|uniref:G-box-binding factor 1 isoform X1 n=1 Tax=Brassica campestris TaxID=3711 RepID=UPI00142DE3E9|nr:G-box-binding factor 1 isoform X1 [Brassica rapa]
MGTSEEKTPSKPASSTQVAHHSPLLLLLRSFYICIFMCVDFSCIYLPLVSQDIPPTPYPDWSNSMQAYYGGGGTPNPFFPSPVGSPSPHPYMWGAQHHMMPPYGTPVPYPAMYPPGAVYAHPGMPMPPASAPTNKETVKEQAPGKKSKGSLKRKGEGGEKAPSGSGNDGVSHSDESVTGGSSDENDENPNHQEQGSVGKPSFGQMLADASSQSNTTGEIQGSVPMKPLAPGTNLNMGMDLWSSQAGVPVKDERELKRQKRKQSNRESARRSRLRKQAECEQLQQRVESLTSENQSLRDELQRLSGECEKLKTQNSSIQDELVRVHGPEAVANLEQNDAGSKDGEGTD